MLCYNKDRSYQNLIEHTDPGKWVLCLCPLLYRLSLIRLLFVGYKKILDLVRREGVMGMKGYFEASVGADGKLHIVTDKLLPAQAW
jgi:hypothetical protein